MIRRCSRATRAPAVTPVGWLMAVIACALVLTACSQTPQWQTRSLEGTNFPPLDVALTGEGGGRLTEARLRGHVTLMFFGYTYCPDICPTTMATLRAALDKLPASERERIKVLFVSVDPARDDPERLADYTEAFGPEFVGATADVKQLRDLTNRYGSTFDYGASNDDGHYLVNHSSHVLAFDQHGQARLLIRQDDSVEAIAHDLGQLASA